MFRSFAAVAALCVTAICSAPAKAEWTVDLGEKQFNDTDAFGGTILMTFKTIVAGTVEIKIENNATAPDGAEPLKILQIVFNIDPDLFAAGATFTFGSFSGPPIANNGTEIKENAEFISPEKMFDGSVKYQSGDSAGQSFVKGDVSIFRIVSSSTDFNEESFRFFNVNDPPEPPDFIAGVHYGYAGGKSGKSGAQGEWDGGLQPESVPLPASVIGLLIAGAGLLTVRRTFSIV